MGNIDTTARTVGSVEKVVVVDDYADVRFAIIEILQCDGYRSDDIYEAADGQEGLVLILKILAEHPHVLLIILTDFDMPKLNGLEMVQALLKVVPEARERVNVILHSANPNAERLATTAGVECRFVPKSVGIEELRAALAAASGSAESEGQ